MEKKYSIRAVLDEKTRIDMFLREHSDITRSQIKNLVKKGCVYINGTIIQAPSSGVRHGDLVEYIKELPDNCRVQREDIPVEIIYEDENIFAVNKQPGIVVHPAPGHFSGTLVNALYGTYFKPENFIGGGARLGIVHRLDKDTSGIMIAAKNTAAREKMAELFKEKKINKTYMCIAHGKIENESFINTYISRDENDRKKYKAAGPGGKEAQTIVYPVKQFSGAVLLEVKILTGRTHQIRVHLQYIKNEIIGDPVYGSKSKDLHILERMGYDKVSLKDIFPRQMLHAGKLEFDHPFTGKPVMLETEPPADIKSVIANFEKRLA
ncbi:MAG: RluA family pseudouridine synthase [Candidatus Goldiibacteriota bacterium]